MMLYKGGGYNVVKPICLVGIVYKRVNKYQAKITFVCYYCKKIW